MSRTVIVINPVSGPRRRGRGAERETIAKRALERLGVEGDVRMTERAGHAFELAAGAAAEGADLVIAWGGDGTINEVGRALVQRAVEGGGGSSLDPAPALGLIPGGSGNGLSRELRIPFDPALAIERAIRSPVRRIDAGELGEHLFFNVAGVGLDAHVAALISTQEHHRGLVPYVKATLGDLLKYRPTGYTIDADGRVFDTSSLMVAVANSQQYGFGAHIAPEASLTDGFLDVVAIADRKLFGNLVRIPSLFARTVSRQRGVTTIKVRQGSIRAASPMLFHVDGEAVQGGDTLAIQVHPAALRVRA